jgi:hypothetical protein
MNPDKRRRLEARGVKFMTVKEFLGLTDEEAAYVELRLKLADGLRARRTARGISQTALAKTMESRSPRWSPVIRRCRWTSWCGRCWRWGRRTGSWPG